MQNSPCGANNQEEADMRYMVLLTRGEWEETAPQDEREKIYSAIGEWWTELASQRKIVGGHQLMPPHTATTVVFDKGESKVIDGPYMEAKEAVGGYGIFEAADLDEVIALVRTLPNPQGSAEIRPVLER
jgi:hypothetical protein